MNRIMLKLGFQTNRRIYASIIGVAVAIMYLTGTLSLVAGLDIGTTNFSERFTGGPVAVFDGRSLSESLIPDEMLENIAGQFSSCKIISVYLPKYEITTYILFVNDSDDLLGVPDDIGNNEVILGSYIANIADSPFIQFESGDTTMEGYVNGSFRSSVFPDTWIMCSESFIERFRPELAQNTSFLILSGQVREDIELFEKAGYTIQPLISLSDFFSEGVRQVEEDLSLIVFSSSIIIILIVYSILSIEISSRRSDIRILKYLGASRLSIVSIFLLESVFIGVFGGLLGISLGFIGANVITSVSSFFGIDTFMYPQVTFSSAVLPLVAAFFSSLLGGLFPSILASRTTKGGAIQ